MGKIPFLFSGAPGILLTLPPPISSKETAFPPGITTFSWRHGLAHQGRPPCKKLL